ncbi:ATP-binding protein [Halobacillus sp. A1]|uniref:ATP-binding protein n=1 Tax=Halobacillus sp. A1 TaxID=2880262 RepID=UPI0020A6A73A|nr:ATP-binding protein [Halobacillus sp. A1]
MENFSVAHDLCIGRVIEVQGTRVKIELDKELDDLTRSYEGRVYSIGQIASILKIHFGRKILFINVRLLRMNSDVDEFEKNTINDDSRIIEADLLGEGIWDKFNEILNFSRGVELYPLPLQSVYLMTDKELDKLYSGAEKNVQNNSSSPLIEIGKYSGSNQLVRANINKLFGNHCAILGSTGSGKSGTVSSILHSVIEARDLEGQYLHPRILMVDPHGEYGKAFKNNAIIYNAYSESNPNDEDTCEIELPYWLMTADEFRSLVIGKTEFEATTQNNIVYEALSYARMVNAGIIKRIKEENAKGGTEPEINEGVQEEERLNFDRDKPVPFKLEDFIFHIDKVQGRKPGKFEQLAQSGRVKIDGILKKLRILRSNPQLHFIMKEYENGSIELPNIISQLVGKKDNDKNLRIIDISGLPNEVAGILTALISRLIFQYKLWQDRELRKADPVLFVCEEAHRYVPNYGEAQYKEAQIAIRRIAKEGRKYGIGLMLVSQRPSDLESTVLSQCNTWIILRLTNSNDQSYVTNFIPDSLSGLTTILPSLTRREAIFVGEAAALPSRIKINELPEDKLPDSSDMDFMQGWKNEQFLVEGIKETTDKWVKNLSR